MAGVKIEVLTAQVQQRLQQITDGGGSAKGALSAFGRVVLNRIRLGFRAGRSPYGQAWAPLKLRAGQPLRDTGALQRSITMSATGNEVVIGTNRVGARVHQFGATIVPVRAKVLAFPGPGGMIFAKRVVVPARPFMPINPAGDMALPPSWAEAGLKAMAKELGL